MKKLALISVFALILSCFAGCASPAAHVEGDLRELITKIYGTYNAREDVAAHLEELAELAKRSDEIGEIIWAPDNGLSEEEIAKLNAELEEIQPRRNELNKYQLPKTAEQDLTSEGTELNPNIVYFIGADDIPFSEGVVSESMIGSLPYSLVMLRMEADSDIESAKTKIKNGVDPQKWICVGVDPSDVVVDNIGDLVILIMAPNSKELHEEFLKLAE